MLVNRFDFIFADITFVSVYLFSDAISSFSNIRALRLMSCTYSLVYSVRMLYISEKLEIASENE